jgi:hypothetical protein
MMKLLWAHALVGTASALLPVIVPMGDNTNDTLLTWGPVTADISANRCRAFAVNLLALSCINSGLSRTFL